MIWLVVCPLLRELQFAPVADEPETNAEVLIEKCFSHSSSQSSLIPSSIHSFIQRSSFPLHSLIYVMPSNHQLCLLIQYGNSTEDFFDALYDGVQHPSVSNINRVRSIFCKTAEKFSQILIMSEMNEIPILDSKF